MTDDPTQATNDNRVIATDELTDPRVLTFLRQALKDAIADKQFNVQTLVKLVNGVGAIGDGEDIEALTTIYRTFRKNPPLPNATLVLNACIQSLLALHNRVNVQPDEEEEEDDESAPPQPENDNPPQQREKAEDS